MLKLLIKKQFFECFKSYFVNPKTNEARSKKSKFSMICLYIFIIVCLGFSFFSLAFSLVDLIKTDFAWLYYALMGIISLSIGVFAGAFNAHNILYSSKDNDFLLSLPIKSSYILTSRLAVVYILAFIYSASAWLPAIICPIIFGTFNIVTLLIGIILLFIIPIFVTVLSALLGYLIAIINSKVNKRGFIATLISLVFLVVYYFAVSKFETFIENIMLNKEEIGSSIKGWGYFLYLLGSGASGNILHFILFTLISILLLTICIYLLSRNYFKIISKNVSVSSSKTKVKFSKQSSISSTLLKKEARRFITNSTYTLNCGLGVIFVIGIAIMAVINSNNIVPVLSLPEFKPYYSFVPLIVLSLILLIISLNVVSTPSISLEGKSLWILKSLPISFSDIFQAKEKLHVMINAIPSIIAMIIIDLTFNINSNNLITACVILFLVIIFEADVGLIVGLINPNFNWTNETTPIKQSINTLISMLVNLVISAALTFIFYLVRNSVTLEEYMYYLTLVLVILVILTRRWLRVKGSIIFNKL